MAVNGGVGDHNAVFLGGVGAPLEVLFKEIAEVAAPDEAVQRANIVKLQPGRLFEHRLHLHAVFADDVGVVAACLVEVVCKEIDLVVEQVTVERRLTVHSLILPAPAGSKVWGKGFPSSVGLSFPLFFPLCLVQTFMLLFQTCAMNSSLLRL